MSHGDEPVLEVRDLKKHYPITDGPFGGEVGRVRAVDGISFDLHENEALGIVGESGCGKSTAASTLVRLEEPTDGEVRFRGDDVGEYDASERKLFRRNVQMVFQDPDSSFDPRMRVGDAVAEPLVVQGLNDERRRREIVADLFERVGLSAADTDRYPHEFSGGEKQRIGLARALAVNPDVIVADEPVSALDASMQSEVLALIQELKAAFGLAIVFISHDLAVVREICDRVAVMYLGEFVELGPTEETFSAPKHPYTRALLSAIPTPDPADPGGTVELEGDVPDPAAPPDGCRFHTRCPEVISPAEIDLPQDVWRDVLRLRQRLRDGTFDLASVAEVTAIEAADDAGGANERATVEALPSAAVRATIRRLFELPSPLPEPTAEDVLGRALCELADGNRDAARDVLDELFVTPCELERPALEAHEPEHLAACHLHGAVPTDVETLRRAYRRRNAPSS